MKYGNEVKEIKEDIQENNELPLPFILNFLEHREGATSSTTCGTWADIDCSDSA